MEAYAILSITYYIIKFEKETEKPGTVTKTLRCLKPTVKTCHGQRLVVFIAYLDSCRLYYNIRAQALFPRDQKR